MKVEQIYTGCLAEAAYYLESNGEAIIIDPLREYAPYLDRAEKSGAKIKYILETHFHADFVSGHRDLAKKSGATIVFGPTAKPAYEAHVAEDGEVLKFGNAEIVVLHTPGHTMESSTFLLRDEQGKDNAIFTGDTLFIGDVGRPDLVQKVKADITPDYLASLLFDSLQNKIMPLANDVIVYPGHGAGSACGKNMSKETTDTLGHQKEVNYALRPGLTKEQFIKEVTDGLVEPPQYFPHNVLMNILGGLPTIDDVLKQGTTALSPDAFQLVQEVENALIIDTRKKDEFTKAFIPGAIFIGIDDSFAPWVGTLVTDLKQPILVIAEEGREEEVVLRLSRVGYDNAKGFLKGGMEAWIKEGKPVDSIKDMEASAFADFYLSNEHVKLLDVRRDSEFKSQHLMGATSFPLDFINSNMSSVQPEQTYYLHCAGGYRSVIAASILKARGFDNLVNILGGFKQLSETEIPKTDYVCPTTML